MTTNQENAMTEEPPAELEHDATESRRSDGKSCDGCDEYGRPCYLPAGHIAPASPLPEGRADGRAVEAALRELVRLKDVKERKEWLGRQPSRDVDPGEFLGLIGDYTENQPRAWAAARAALSPPVAEPESGDPFTAADLGQLAAPVVGEREEKP